jgi:hypothetical protein
VTVLLHRDSQRHRGVFLFIKKVWREGENKFHLSISDKKSEQDLAPFPTLVEMVVKTSQGLSLSLS